LVDWLGWELYRLYDSGGRSKTSERHLIFLQYQAQTFMFLLEIILRLLREREGFAMRRLAARATVCVSVSVCVEADFDGRADKRFSFSLQGGERGLAG
jgi:hypothetical protein